MSTTLMLANQAPILADQGQVTVLAASTGVFDWATEKLADLSTLIKAAAVVAGIGFILYRAIATKGAPAAIVIAIACAAVFIYGVWNVSDLKDRVATEVNSAPASSSQLGEQLLQHDLAQLGARAV